MRTVQKAPKKRFVEYLLMLSMLALLGLIGESNQQPTLETIYFRSSPPLAAYQMEFAYAYLKQQDGVQKLDIVDAGHTFKVELDTHKTTPQSIRQALECSRAQPGDIGGCMQKQVLAAV